MNERNDDHDRTDGGAQTTTNLDGDVAIVTGSSRGIGRATAERLANDGASVLVNYVADEDAAKDTLDAIDADGGEAIVVQGDVSEADDVERVFDEAEAAFGRVFDVNAKGTFLVLREAANRIAEGGRIVDFSTVGTARGGSGIGPYAGSKAAGERMVIALAEELGEWGIRVNTVSPGITDTDGLLMSDETVERMVEQTPLGRRGRADEVADVVAFLVSADGRWVTGQTIHPSGGWEIGW